ERSHWSGNGVHVEPESVFMIGRNMQLQRPGIRPRAVLEKAHLKSTLLISQHCNDPAPIIQTIIIIIYIVWHSCYKTANS
ncbi:hypothetical protein, partial [Aeromonas sp. JL9]|uniref:hypothetical protein n=1 Tax=Aeromonas sp. JL9 TaxID=2950549 RepID=UPI002108809D